VTVNSGSDDNIANVSHVSDNLNNLRRPIVGLSISQEQPLQQQQQNPFSQSNSALDRSVPSLVGIQLSSIPAIHSFDSFETSQHPTSLVPIQASVEEQVPIERNVLSNQEADIFVEEAVQSLLSEVGSSMGAQSSNESHPGLQ
jgi:hypothetical protein